MTRRTLPEFLDGRAGISAEMAVRLSNAFGGSVESWLRQQMHYDLAQIEKQPGEIRGKHFEPM